MKKLISVIIPIYNVEEYLEETIESVVNQTIGFKDNIELILVNDGSPDNSEKICLKYKELYPDNVIYIKQKNAGVSAARNNGLEHATGKYVNFLDSDDKWELNAYEKIISFFEKKYNDVDIVASQIEFFEGQKGLKHPLNYKFKKSCVVDLNKEPDNVLMHLCSSIIKREAIDIKFDLELKYAEDSKFINTILIKKMKLGLIKKPHFLYRKRISQNSAMDKCLFSKNYYINTINYYHDYILNISEEKFGKVIPYLQYLIMYDVQWRLKSEIPEDVLTLKEKNEYINHLKGILKKIDYNVIFNQKNIGYEYKLYALELRDGLKGDKEYIVKGKKIYYKDILIYDLVNNPMVEVNVLNVFKDRFEIDGQINSPFENYKLYVEINGKKEELKIENSFRFLRVCPTGELLRNREFHIKDNLKPGKNIISFYLNYKNIEVQVIPNFTVNSHLDNKLLLHYIKNGNVSYFKKNSIIIKKNSFITNTICEAKLFLQIIKEKKFKVLFFRYPTKLLKLVYGKKVWLISDRTNVANDNGMHFFKYVTKVNDKSIKPFFVVNKKSKSFNEMKKYGNVVPYNSYKYKILFLLANKIVSSQADVWVINAYGKNNLYYRDMYKFDFIFLQHGITKNDQTQWLNKINKNIKMLVTVSPKEQNSFLELNYGYNENVVKLTGFPRYDNLKSDSKKQIAIMPTWREYLSGYNNINDGERDYNPEFKNSEYFKFYNSLINDKRILKRMKEKGFTGIFVIHPSHEKNFVDFKGNDIIKINKGFADYQKIFMESDLLISDYSSVTFDFAYLYKPVIYAHFDKDFFFANHIYSEGYYKDERDGFGKVVENYEDTVKEILRQLDANCVMDDKYRKRVDKFYKFHDQNNCERVYNEIKKI